jgi:AcrR family transcriptional regulator
MAMERFREKALLEARQSPDSTKARILQAAEDLFARYGYDGTTTRDIAEDAGVNLAQVHYHWGTKEELLFAVYFNLVQTAMDYVGEYFSGLEGKASVDDIRGMIAAVFNFMADYPNIPRMMQKPWPRNVERPDDRRGGVPVFDLVKSFILTRTDIDVSPADLDMALYCVTGAIEFFFVRPSLVEAVFSEDAENMSPEFREKAIETLWVLTARLGKIEGAP